METTVSKDQVKVNKGGRPQAKLKRRQLLSVMCNLLERKIIEGNARRAGLPVSIYLRELGLNSNVRFKRALPKEVLLAIGALNHLSANLNQIAKKRNRGEYLNAMERALLNQEVRSLQIVVGNIKAFLS